MVAPRRGRWSSPYHRNGACYQEAAGSRSQKLASALVGQLGSAQQGSDVWPARGDVEPNISCRKNKKLNLIRKRLPIVVRVAGTFRVKTHPENLKIVTRKSAGCQGASPAVFPEFCGRRNGKLMGGDKFRFDSYKRSGPENSYGFRRSYPVSVPEHIQRRH